MDLVDTPFDCQTCGACCLSPWDGLGYVRLEETDVERLAPTALPVVRQEQPGWGDETELLIRLQTVRDRHERRACVALAGCAGERCSCGVYDVRPDACRRFEAGSSLCRAARRRVGLSA
jgi:uncharacterized protein